MIFVVELSFDGNPERLNFRPAHREVLKELKARGEMVMAGPFADDSGALLIVDVEDADALDKLLGDDPYYTAPGVTVTSKRHWTPVIAAACDL